MTSTDTLSNAPTRSASPINADAITVEPTKSLADAVRNVLHPQRNAMVSGTGSGRVLLWEA